MSEILKTYENNFSASLKSIESDVYNSDKTGKNNILQFSFILDDCRKKLLLSEEKAYSTLAKEFPADEEVWYLYSLFILMNKDDLETAFSLSQRSIDILAKKMSTTSAFSKHFIGLAIKLEKFALARDELIRISHLIDLSLEQKRYFSTSLRVLETQGFLPEIYREALSP